MSSILKRRLDKVATQVAALPHVVTKEENRKWAERQIDDIMQEYRLTRSKAIELAKEHAPTVAEFLGV
ncbi:MAG TPA: hypothetical protein VLR90_01605 [Blastocatellia bacterium]|nr:hypothetical protein [Blastocatellia bacterium]